LWCWNSDKFCPKNNEVGQNYTRKTHFLKIARIFFMKKVKICSQNLHWWEEGKLTYCTIILAYMLIKQIIIIFQVYIFINLNFFFMISESISCHKKNEITQFFYFHKNMFQGLSNDKIDLEVMYEK
jgi:hypothetical protein